MATINVGFVPRAGKFKAGAAGTPTTVADNIVAAIRAEILRQDPADLQQMRQKQADADKAFRNGSISSLPLIGFPYKSQPTT